MAVYLTFFMLQIKGARHKLIKMASNQGARHIFITDFVKKLTSEKILCRSWVCQCGTLKSIMGLIWGSQISSAILTDFLQTLLPPTHLYTNYLLYPQPTLSSCKHPEMAKPYGTLTIWAKYMVLLEQPRLSSEHGV